MLEIVKGPYLQWPTRESMTIMWETSRDAASMVTYFETQRVHSGGLRTLHETEKKVKNSAARRIHTLTLSGLEADTTYHYKASSRDSSGETVESNRHCLKTAVSEETPFSFCVTSETGTCGDSGNNVKVFSQIARYRPEFILLVGDAVSDGGVYEQWDQYLFGPAKDLLSSTPFYLCLGNHEKCSPWFYKFVTYPDPKNYYAFDYGNAHFVGLDCTSEEDYRDGTLVPTEAGRGFMPGSAQYEFLVTDLESSSATWKFVFFHYPPYVSGDYQVEQMRVLCPVFEEHGVDIVFNSHTIVYERSHPLRNNRIDMHGGVIYIVAGGAGARPAWFHNKRAWHTAQAVAVPHFVQVVIAENVLQLNAIDHQGQLLDTVKLA